MDSWFGCNGLSEFPNVDEIYAKCVNTGTVEMYFNENPRIYDLYYSNNEICFTFLTSEYCGGTITNENDVVNMFIDNQSTDNPTINPNPTVNPNPTNIPTSLPDIPSETPNDNNNDNVGMIIGIIIGVVAIIIIISLTIYCTCRRKSKVVSKATKTDRV